MNNSITSNKRVWSSLAAYALIKALGLISKGASSGRGMCGLCSKASGYVAVLLKRSLRLHAPSSIRGPRYQSH